MKFRYRIFFGGVLIINLFLIALFFDPKAHIGGDDSDYIVASMDFLNGVSFPSWHGSFYPIFLSPFIARFGINLVLLKSVSVVLSILSSIILFKTFYKKIPDPVLYFSLSIVCFSYYMVFYNSTTYSEPLFIFIQSLLFFSFTRVQDDFPNSPVYRKYLLFFALAFFTFLLSITRNVGWGAWISITIYFAIEKKWAPVILFNFFFLLLHALFLFYKNIVWGAKQIGMEGQFSQIAYKNFYNSTEGTEDTLGFIIRFWENSKLYLSKHLAVLIGIRPVSSVSTFTSLTILFYLAFIVIIFLAYKRNKIVFSILLYVGCVLGVTFVTQQTHWDQVRLILVYLSLISIALGFLFQWVAECNVKILSYTGKILLIGLPYLVLVRTIATQNNLSTTISNLTGDHFKGYPEEWKNYVLVSEWAGSHIKENKNILCRKPSLSSIYGGRQFQGLSRFTYTVGDSADQLLLKKKVDYLILDNLSMPTIWRLLRVYLLKYPLGLKVHYAQGMNSKSSTIVEVVRTSPLDDSDYLSRIQAGLLVYPDIIYFYSLAADKYFSLRDFSNAATFYTHAIEKAESDQDRSLIYTNRAKVFIHLNQWGNARKDIAFVLSHEPHNEEAKQILKFIDASKKSIRQ